MESGSPSTSRAGASAAAGTAAPAADLALPAPAEMQTHIDAIYAAKHIRRHTASDGTSRVAKALSLAMVIPSKAAHCCEATPRTPLTKAASKASAASLVGHIGNDDPAAMTRAILEALACPWQRRENVGRPGTRATVARCSRGISPEWRPIQLGQRVEYSGSRSSEAPTPLSASLVPPPLSRSFCPVWRPCCCCGCYSGDRRLCECCQICARDHLGH